MFFFFKQKTAYEMRISDWSSDVCSSDLVGIGIGEHAALAFGEQPGDHRRHRLTGDAAAPMIAGEDVADLGDAALPLLARRDPADRPIAAGQRDRPAAP